MSFLIVGAAAVGAGATIYGAHKSSSAAKRASRDQASAADRANQMQWDMFQQQRQDNEPWRVAGRNALTQLGNADFQRDFTMADFQKDPGYEFRMREGEQGLNRMAAAKGAGLSGSTLKALAQYGQNFASNEYGNAYNRFNADRDRRFNRLSSLAGVGQTANSQLAAAGQNYAGMAGQNLMGAANAGAAARMASANAWGGAASGLGQAAMDGAWMHKWNQQQQLPKADGPQLGGQSYLKTNGLA